MKRLNFFRLVHFLKRMNTLQAKQDIPAVQIQPTAASLQPWPQSNTAALTD